MYPEPGHSFLPNDRCFGRIEKKRKRLERVYLPETYHELVRNTSKNFKVIKVTQDIIFNFSDNLKTIFKKTVTGVDKNSKFSIMAYRYMEYNSEGLYCSMSGQTDVQILASKYVPPDYIWFYRNLVEENTNSDDICMSSDDD